MMHAATNNIKWGKGLLPLFCGVGVMFLLVAAPGEIEAAKPAPTQASRAATQADTAGGCGDDAADAARSDAGLKLPPGVASPLSQIMPQDDACYEPFLPGGGKNRRCEPQCIPYARCRSGIDSCRTGMENGPLTWFACEEQRGNTAAVPAAGSVLILASNPRRKMSTGHGLYVEAVEETAPASYRLILSHTNFDRRCSIETNIEARFDQRQMTVDFLSGAWRAWGQDLAVAGFILGSADEATP